MSVEELKLMECIPSDYRVWSLFYDFYYVTNLLHFAKPQLI